MRDLAQWSSTNPFSWVVQLVRWEGVISLKQVVFRSTVDSFERKQTYKDLRHKDVSGYAHAMLIHHGSNIDLVKHELNKCVSAYQSAYWSLSILICSKEYLSNATTKLSTQESTRMSKNSISRVRRRSIVSCIVKYHKNLDCQKWQSFFCDSTHFKQFFLTILRICNS